MESAFELVVVLVASDPDPGELVWAGKVTNRAIVVANPSRIQLVMERLESDGRIAGIPQPNLIILMR
jgi:hypothetical protein